MRLTSTPRVHAQRDSNSWLAAVSTVSHRACAAAALIQIVVALYMLVTLLVLVSFAHQVPAYAVAIAAFATIVIGASGLALAGTHVFAHSPMRVAAVDAAAAAVAVSAFLWARDDLFEDAAPLAFAAAVPTTVFGAAALAGAGTAAAATACALARRPRTGHGAAALRRGATTPPNAR